MTENDAYEVAYNNGKEYMRKCIIDKLKEMKGVCLGVTRMVLDEAIRMVEKLEVRP